MIEEDEIPELWKWTTCHQCGMDLKYRKERKILYDRWEGPWTVCEKCYDKIDPEKRKDYIQLKSILKEEAKEIRNVNF